MLSLLHLFPHACPSALLPHLSKSPPPTPRQCPNTHTPPAAQQWTGEQQSRCHLQRTAKALTVQKERRRTVPDLTDLGSGPHRACVGIDSALTCPPAGHATALLPRHLAVRCRGFPDSAPPWLLNHLPTYAPPLPQVPINHPATGCRFSKLPSACLHLG